MRDLLVRHNKLTQRWERTRKTSGSPGKRDTNMKQRLVVATMDINESGQRETNVVHYLVSEELEDREFSNSQAGVSRLWDVRYLSEDKCSQQAVP